MWPCLLFYSQGLELCLAHMGAPWVFVEWMSINQETSKCIFPQLLIECLLWNRYWFRCRGLVHSPSEWTFWEGAHWSPYKNKQQRCHHIYKSRLRGYSVPACQYPLYAWQEARSCFHGKPLLGNLQPCPSTTLIPFKHIPVKHIWCFLFKDPIREYYRPTSLSLPLGPVPCTQAPVPSPQVPTQFPGPEELVPAHRGLHVDLPLRTGLGHCSHCPPLGLAHTSALPAGFTIVSTTFPRRAFLDSKES